MSGNMDGRLELIVEPGRSADTVCALCSGHARSMYGLAICVRGEKGGEPVCHLCALKHDPALALRYLLAPDSPPAGAENEAPPLPREVTVLMEVQGSLRQADKAIGRLTGIPF